MADARLTRFSNEQLIRLQAAVAAGDIWQLGGEPAVARAAGGTAVQTYFDTDGKYSCTKTTGIVLLDGGDAWWDHSANSVTYRRVNDRDFLLGKVIGDCASGDATCVVDFGKRDCHDHDVSEDPHDTTVVGTQGLNTMGVFRRGGAHEMILSSTNEAQKMDILGVDGVAVGANMIVEAAFRVVSDGAGSAPDFNIGIANDTHATDADSITQHLLCHLDGNSTNISFQSKDGTTTVTAQDSTKDYTESALAANRVEVWMDCRNPADVVLYVNGEEVLTGTTFDISAGAGPWRLLAHLEKTAAADTYRIVVDKLRMRIMEQ